MNARLDGQELGPDAPPERLPEVIDARGVQIRKAVALHVHTDLEDLDARLELRRRIETAQLDLFAPAETHGGWGGIPAAPAA